MVPNSSDSLRATAGTLVWVALAAVCIPLVLFLFLGQRLDEFVSELVTPLPSPFILAVLEIGLLSADIFLPVPSSAVATLGGAHLGTLFGTLCAWCGMTLGGMFGWWIGHQCGATWFERRLSVQDRKFLENILRKAGPVLIVVTRPLPLLAEAAAIVSGTAGMRWSDFLLSNATGTFVTALLWSATGALGKQWGILETLLEWSLVIPIAATWLLLRTWRTGIDMTTLKPQPRDTSALEKEEQQLFPTDELHQG